MDFLSGYRFLLAASAALLVVLIGLPFVWKEIRKKRRAGELAKRIIPVSSLTAADIAKIRSLHPQGKKMYPAVNRAVCVGCGSCVQSCQEKDVLAVINGKSTLINPLACRCRGDCERNCVTGGLKLVEYGQKLKVRVPWTDENHESNIKGIYIVGSLTGAALIKEAINQGRIAVNHIMKGAFPPDLPTVMVIGAGPAGLSAMLSCRKFGLPVICFEKDRTANTIRNFPKKKFVMAEPVEMPIVGPLWVGDASRERLLEAWEGILEKAGACIATGSRLEMIEKQGGRFQVTVSGKIHACDKVILALGNRGVPRKLGIPGEDGDNVFYNLLEADEFSGSAVTVIGAGDSAIEAALALQRNGCRVTLLVRGDGFPKAKARNVERIGQALADGRIRVYYNSQPLAIGAGSITFASGGETHLEKADSVFVMAGGELPFALLEKIGIDIVEMEI
jgi:thioredoxin reductase (NADPH)